MSKNKIIHTVQRETSVETITKWHDEEETRMFKSSTPLPLKKKNHLCSGCPKEKLKSLQTSNKQQQDLLDSRFYCSH